MKRNSLYHALILTALMSTLSGCDENPVGPSAEDSKPIIHDIYGYSWEGGPYMCEQGYKSDSEYEVYGKFRAQWDNGEWNGTTHGGWFSTLPAANSGWAAFGFDWYYGEQANPPAYFVYPLVYSGGQVYMEDYTIGQVDPDEVYDDHRGWIYIDLIDQIPSLVGFSTVIYPGYNWHRDSRGDELYLDEYCDEDSAQKARNGRKVNLTQKLIAKLNARPNRHLAVNPIRDSIVNTKDKTPNRFALNNISQPKKIAGKGDRTHNPGKVVR